MNKFSTSLLSADELNTSASRIDSIANAHVATDPLYLKLSPPLKASLKSLTTALGRSTDSSYVKLLGEKDIFRDVKFVSLRDFCKGFTYDEDPAVASAAATIVKIIKDVGWSLYAEGNALESSLLETLFLKLDAAPAKAALTKLNATTRYTALKDAQVDFEVTFKSKVDAKAQEVYPYIRESRLTVARYVNALLSYIDIMAELDGAAYKTAADRIDEVIVEFEAMARNRATRKKNEEKVG